MACALALSVVLAAQALTSPYPLPTELPLLATLFLFIVVLIHLLATRRRWYEVTEVGIRYQLPLGRVRTVAWSAVRDVRYFAGVGIPFSVKVAGRRTPFLLGVHHPDLPAWTSACLERMPLDNGHGGPLATIRKPGVYWTATGLLGAALIASPMGVLRALNGAPAFGLWLVAVGGLAGALAVRLRQPLSWNPAGVRLGRGRWARAFPWETVHAEWRRTVSGTAGLYLQLGDARTMRVLLGGWGAPRFVARLAPLRPPTVAPGRTTTLGTGALFPGMLAVFTLVAGVQFRASARLFSELTTARTGALVGEQTVARVTAARANERGIHVRYMFEADGQRYRGHGWLLASASEALQKRAFIPVRYARERPQHSVPGGDPTLYYAVYYGLFALFHVFFVIPLLALWNIIPAPEPATVPPVAT